MTYEPSKEAVSKTHWPGPTPEMLDQPDFNAIWDCIKTWDINVPHAYEGYCGATGNHARAILDALTPVLAALIAGHEDAAVPEGWKLVPIEPTVEMLRDGANQCLNFYSEKGPYPRSRAVYRAMLNAAPPAPETKK